MKTTLLLLCMALLGSVTNTAMAQTTKKTPAENKAMKDAEKLAKELGLDDKQKEKVYAANLGFEKELEKLDKTKLTKEEKAAKKEALRQKQLSHLQTVLKPEQYEKVAAKLNGKQSKKQPQANKGQGNSGNKGNSQPKKTK